MYLGDIELARQLK